MHGPRESAHAPLAQCALLHASRTTASTRVANVIRDAGSPVICRSTWLRNRAGVAGRIARRRRALPAGVGDRDGGRAGRLCPPGRPCACFGRRSRRASTGRRRRRWAVTGAEPYAQPLCRPTGTMALSGETVTGGGVGAAGAGVPAPLQDRAGAVGGRSARGGARDDAAGGCYGGRRRGRQDAPGSIGRGSAAPVAARAAVCAAGQRAHGAASAAIHASRRMVALRAKRST